MPVDPSTFRREAEKLKLVVKQAEQQLARVRELLDRLEEFECSFGTGPRPVADCIPKLDRLLARRGGRSQRAQVTAACAEILADGVHRFSRDLVPELQARGIRLGGRSPKSLVATYLSQDERFVSEQKLGGWTLRQAPLPALTESTTSARPNRAGVTEEPNPG